MTRDRRPLNRWVQVGQSVGPALILLWLLHRAMARAEAHPDALLLRGFLDFGQFAWTWPYLIAVAVACVWVVLRRNHTALVRVQWVALGCGLFLTLYGLGGEVGEKVDPRFVFAILGGVASLYACYACLLGYVALWMLSWKRPSNGLTP